MIKECIKESIFKIMRLLFIIILVGTVTTGVFWSVTGRILVTYIIPFSVFISIFISLYIIEKREFKDIGMSFNTRDIVLIFGGGITACIFYAMVILSLPGINNFLVYKDLILNFKARSLIGVLVIPLSEEMINRGYILNNTFEKLKFYQISCISALIFSMAHWPYVSGTPIIQYILISIISTFLFGLAFNNIMRLTKTIWFGVGFHWIFNYFGLVMFVGNKLSLYFISVTLIFLVIVLLITSIMGKKIKI